MSKLTELFEPRCIHRHTARTHPKCFDKSGKAVDITQPRPNKILVFDIETLPIVAYVWKVWQENISKKQIIKDWCVLSWSAKWLDDDRIMSDVLTHREAITRNDKRLVTSFHKLLEEADVVVAHNGKKFDVKKMNARFWKHRLPKPSSYKVVDTLSAVRSVFGLTYNNQDFIAQYIEAQEKLETDFDLWSACDRGEETALKYMLDYNEVDVRGLEQIYMELREWIPSHPDMRVYANIQENCCPVCLSERYENIGYYTAKSNKYPEHRCNSCRTVWHDSKAVKE